MPSNLIVSVLSCISHPSRSADTSIFINWFLSFKIIRSCFTFRFYYIAGLKGQIDILVSFIMPLLIILRASPLCCIARHVRRTDRISCTKSRSKLFGLLQNRAGFLCQSESCCYMVPSSKSASECFL
jgi:hypothetical protein